MTADICVMVPTIRNHECMRSYFQNARDHGFDLDRLFVVLITEDFCDTDAMEQMLDEEGVDGAVYDGAAREAWFENHGASEYSHLIPEASHAQTSFGLLYMWASDYEYGVFIDDDTLPHEDTDFFGTHMENLAFEGEMETVSSDKQWVNVLYQNEDEHGLYPRGYPYAAMDETVETEQTHVDDVVASQGLWTNVPDLDAVRILMDGDLQGQAQTRTDGGDFGEDFVAADGQYLTVCSMNLAFRREVIPAFYQLPMDDNEWDVGRFDDIWSGVFLKRACDVLDKQIYNGDPLCEHNKAPRSTFSDLTNEVHGLELNEHVWEIVDEAGADADSYAEVFDAIATAMADGDFSDWENGAFLNYCGEFMLDWLECLDELDAAATEQVPATADD
ncbi:alpha-1 4-glucan-protein synthase [Haloarcula sp. CBA1130]|uniref:alpha-1 4-glucan-protein synthase n=1 Tax=unclassified Haloarcula TaxID=2624677 RepID=UPI0012490F88|nr:MULTISPECIES: alpha-1 4-glucan-protein synthase [unclassified Haloarcula]KAA9397415.1 alpha-1 4-glucan-protein synthase [Haloarcula sp. CBA1129]KAA9402552.1 alpha-1 4-glucan-protein synthase [Haloarcula sp. CBA1130]